MKTTMIAFAASTAVATAAVKDVSGWVSVTTPAKANSKCYTEAEAPAKEKWTKTFECRKLCGAYPLGSGTVPGTIDGKKCGEQTKTAASGEYPARVKCVGTWQTVTPKCGDEDKDGERPLCSAKGTAAKTVTNEFKCLNQDGDDFALDAEGKCGAPTFLPLWAAITGSPTAVNKTALDAAVAVAETGGTFGGFAYSGLQLTTKTCAAIEKCAPKKWKQSNPCDPSCGQAATKGETKTYKCVDQKGDEIALVDDKCGDGAEGGAKKTETKQDCPKTDECDTYPACPLASGAEKVAMTAAVAIAAIAMF